MGLISGQVFREFGRLVSERVAYTGQHTSVQYPMMLIAQAFMLLLKRWSKNELDSEAIPKTLMYQDVPRTLLDILGRTMRSQEADGSWESKREVTAYAVLTLAPLLSLPWVDFLKPEGIACMYRGKAYLENNRHLWREPERVWIEKTVYGSPNLSQAYCLAASKVIVPTAFVSSKISDMFPPQLAKKLVKMSGFFSLVVPFSGAPKWKLQLSMLQSANYAAALRASRFNIFPQIEKASDEKYQEYIPFTWIGCRDYLSTAISAETLWDMMLVSMFNFQVDAYMETVVWERYRNRLPELRALIRAICSAPSEKRKRANEGDVGGRPKKLLGSNGVVGHNNCRNGVANQRTNGASTVFSNGTFDKAHPGLVNGAASSTNCQAYENSNESANGVQHKRVDSGTEVNEMNGNSVNGISNGVQKSISNGAANGCKEKQNVNGGRAHTNGESGFEKAPMPAKDDAMESETGSTQAVDDSGGDVEEVLSKFVNFALQHPKVLQSPEPLRAWLAHELQTFLLAHITHMEDCEGLPCSWEASNGPLMWARPRTTFFNWVRTTSADHTSCPYSFVFFLCLIGENGRAVISSIQQRYALEDACRHLATMCRQYNDLGSVARDQEEKNLNSVNFPEFGAGDDDEPATAAEKLQRRKRDLLAVAEYERRCLGRVVTELESSLDPSVMEKLRLFVQVTDLYGQIYVVRDIGIRRVEGGGGPGPKTIAA